MDKDNPETLVLEWSNARTTVCRLLEQGEDAREAIIRLSNAEDALNRYARKKLKNER